MIKNLCQIRFNIFEKLQLLYCFVHRHVSIRSIIRRLCQGRFLLRNGFMLWTHQPSTAVRCGAQFWIFRCTYIRMYMYVWGANTIGCAATIISREYRGRRNCASIERGVRQRDLILRSDARLGNMILSTGVRAMMQAAKTHPYRTPYPKFSTPLLSAAHRLAARSPV